MVRQIIGYAVLFIILFLLQVIVFNQVCIFNVAVPFVYIFFILRLPYKLNLNLAFTLAFILGLIIDIFSNTAGMCALACTILCALKKPVFLLYVPRDEDNDNLIPSIKSLGLGVYMKYASTLTLIYCILICLIQSFSFMDFDLLVIRILCSFILTFVLIMGIESLINSSSAQRL